MSYYTSRRQIQVRWRSAAFSLMLVVILAFPVAGLVAVLLGMAHSIDPAVPALGWEAVYPLIAVAWLVHWLLSVEVNIDE